MLTTNVSNKDQAQEVSVRDKDYRGYWTQGHACYALAKDFSASCPDTEIKASLLNNLEGEISKPSNIKAMKSYG